MTPLQLRQLRAGDLIQSSYTNMLYVVTDAAADHVTAVQTVDVEDAEEWILVTKARYRAGVHRARPREDASHA